MPNSSSAFISLHGEPRHPAPMASESRATIPVPLPAERWLRGNPGRTIYTAHLPYSNANTASTAGKQPSPISSAFGSENAAPVFANDFEWNGFSREPISSFEFFEGIPQPERTPLGNASNFPTNIFGSANMSVDSADSELHFAIGFAGYGQSSGLIFEEPLLNGNLEPRYMGHSMPEPAPYERSVEEEGLLRFVEPHWLTLKQPSPKASASPMSHAVDISMSSDDNFGSVFLDQSTRECEVFGDEADLEDSSSSRSSSPASSVDGKSEEEYLPSAHSIQVPLATRRSQKVQKRALSYPSSRPRRNMQVDDEELGSSSSSLVLPPGASHPSLGSTSLSSGCLGTLSSPAKKVMLELEPDALTCPICNFVPRGAIDDIDGRGSTSRGLSSERRRTLRRHFDSHFSSSRVICYEKPNPNGEGFIGGCRKSLSRPDAMIRHLKSCPGPSKKNHDDED